MPHAARTGGREVGGVVIDLISCMLSRYNEEKMAKAELRTFIRKYSCLFTLVESP